MFLITKGGGLGTGGVGWGGVKEPHTAPRGRVSNRNSRCSHSRACRGDWQREGKVRGHAGTSHPSPARLLIYSLFPQRCQLSQSASFKVHCGR